jgi:glucokinase
MLLAGDIGGTKTLLGLFEPATPRPVPSVIDEFTTLEYESLEAIIERFLGRHRVAPRDLTAASFGVAGAVTEQSARLTNVPWLVSAAGMRRELGIGRPYILNDLEALAYAVEVLNGEEQAVLQAGERIPSGNAAVIAAGTGLGESLLLHVDGRLIPGESEGGHADFAARRPRELEMVAVLARVYGRVSNEHILSGPGLVNVYQFTHRAFGADRRDEPGRVDPSRLCDGVGEVGDPSDLPARISQSAMANRCAACVEALGLFVEAYGAEAGNLALRTVATAGVWVGGGIAPRILPALQSGRFMAAFQDKAPLQHLVERIPVSVILNPRAGLLGAAVHANAASAI